MGAGEKWLHMEVFGSSGVRGVVNERMTPAFAVAIAQAAGTVLDAPRIAVARDTRTSGRMLVDAVASGLASVGVDIDRLGIVPTPAAQQYADSHGCPAVLVTASHNPPQFNGIKLVGADGIGLAVPTLERIEEQLQAGTTQAADWAAIGETRRIETLQSEYIDAVQAAVDRETIADSGLTVALDPGHGAGCYTSPQLLRELGCDVLTVNAQPDGRFPGRNPEPVPEQLTDLARLVRTSDADVGIAHDGDADRAVFIDETGEPIDGSASLAALAAAELESGDTMVSAVNVSQRVIDAVEAADATLERTPIGSTHLVSRIRELRADNRSVPIAGEGNGGIMYPPYRTARDGGYTAGRFLELIADRPASEVVAPYRGYRMARRNFEYDDAEQRAAMLERAAQWARSQEGDLDTKDGYRVDFGDAWTLIRPSGTEPLIRAYAEATDTRRVTDLLDAVGAAIADD